MIYKCEVCGKEAKDLSTIRDCEGGHCKHSFMYRIVDRDTSVTVPITGGSIFTRHPSQVKYSYVIERTCALCGTKERVSITDSQFSQQTLESMCEDS